MFNYVSWLRMYINFSNPPWGRYGRNFKRIERKKNLKRIRRTRKKIYIYCDIESKYLSRERFSLILCISTWLNLMCFSPNEISRRNTLLVLKTSLEVSLKNLIWIHVQSSSPNKFHVSNWLNCIFFYIFCFCFSFASKHFTPCWFEVFGGAKSLILDKIL